MKRTDGTTGVNTDSFGALGLFLLHVPAFSTRGKDISLVKKFKLNAPVADLSNPPGGFRHGHHIAFKRDNNTPLANLYVSMLQRLGVETGTFASSTSRLSALEIA